MQSANGRIALVSGCSSGIGLATAVALAGAGFEVVATLRSLERADALRASAAAHGVTLDLRELDVVDENSVRRCIDAVLAAHGRLDVLVNNAGTGHRGTLEQLSEAEIAACMDVNFWGVLRLTRAVLPGMRAAQRGRVITVTSMNGLIGLPFSDAYNAAKFAVEGLMEGLAPVLSAFGIAVSMIEPGPVKTGFLTNMRGQVGAAGADDPYAALLDGYNRGMRARFADAGESPEQVAQVIVAAALDASPKLRYQSSPAATAMAARKIVDPSGASVLAATRAMLGLA